MPRLRESLGVMSGQKSVYCPVITRHIQLPGFIHAEAERTEGCTQQHEILSYAVLLGPKAENLTAAKITINVGAL